MSSAERCNEDGHFGKLERKRQTLSAERGWSLGRTHGDVGLTGLPCRRGVVGGRGRVPFSGSVSRGPRSGPRACVASPELECVSEARQAPSLRQVSCVAATERPGEKIVPLSASVTSTREPCGHMSRKAPGRSWKPLLLGGRKGALGRGHIPCCVFMHKRLCCVRFLVLYFNSMHVFFYMYINKNWFGGSYGLRAATLCTPRPWGRQVSLHGSSLAPSAGARWTRT